ncbi:MAG: hypothetical protein NW208_18395 [Bryobacter sp.]|nr:hypothetical protein [Bryobacter sp.]
MPITRRTLLTTTAATLSLQANGPTREMIQEMVGASHAKPQRVRELLAHHPSLALATLDWGFGDWESALGAASHVGNREIAEMLLAHGARPTIFSAAMLGQLDVVKAFLAAQPGIEKTRGPHGITLFVHAKGPVKEYLKAFPDAHLSLPNEPVSPERQALVAGVYRSADGQTTFTIDSVRGQLGVNGPSVSARRNLLLRPDGTFFPSGAPWASFSFEGATLKFQNVSFTATLTRQQM